MKDIILLIVLILMGIAGYFLMGKLDKFLEENQKSIEKEKHLHDEESTDE